MAKSQERFDARKLRRLGKSILSIAKRVNVSKSTVSLWCSDIELTRKQRERLVEKDKKGGAVGRQMAAANRRKERLFRLAEFMNKGKKLVGPINKRDLFIAGIALYWAEGNKKNRRLVFSNSDPAMIKLLIGWLVECLGVSKGDIYCKVGINQIHKDRVKKVEKYWSDVTGISLVDFRRVSLKKTKTKKIYENMNEHFGTLNLFVRRSTNLNYLILGLIDGLSLF